MPISPTVLFIPFLKTAFQFKCSKQSPFFKKNMQIFAIKTFILIKTNERADLKEGFRRVAVLVCSGRARFDSKVMKRALTFGNLYPKNLVGP